MKWTPYQLRVIEALKDGERLYYLSGINAYYFIGRVKPRPTERTVNKLKQANIITLVKADWRGSVWKWAKET